MAKQKKKIVYKRARTTAKAAAKTQADAKPAVPKPATVELSKAKGRPMLVWVGKKPLERLTAFPAQKIEQFAPSTAGLDKFPKMGGDAWSPDYPEGGLLFHGDNKEVLAHLLANGFRGKVKLIYIDPPFDSGADYVRKVELRDTVLNSNLGADEYALGEQIQYTDIWANDNYLQFLYERLMLLREFLAEDGSIYVHTDCHKTHHIRCLLDEVFGDQGFKNDLVWQRFNYRADGLKFGTVHDTILFYTKGSDYQFEKPYVELKPSYIKTHFRPDEKGRMFRLDNLTAPSHGKVGRSLKFGDNLIAPPPGTMWRHAQTGIDELWSKDLIVVTETGTPQIKRYLDEIQGQAVHSLWTDLNSINSQSNERTDYPTQKPECLLERIINTSTKSGDLIFDCFIGSGTTAAVAQKLGRRWIGCDINKGAIQTTSKRLQSIIADQIEEQKKKAHQPTLGLPEEVKDEHPAPAQYSFSVYRVNDYDLQIQHNEAVNLACEHVGITRTKTDSFFDGSVGKKLVKIVPFNHPVTQLDLEQIKGELKSRPNETRDVVVVALGKELATDAWLAGWNKLRAKGDVPNKIELIELRTDQKYGKFIEHKPATAKVSVKRVKEKAIIVIDNFISPTIVERLNQQEGPLRPHITDWRSMVDCVMIDPHYDGSVFTVALSDVPEKKNDFVHGKYEMAIGKAETTVAIKIIDMLGEELIITKKI